MSIDKLKEDGTPLRSHPLCFVIQITNTAPKGCGPAKPPPDGQTELRLSPAGRMALPMPGAGFCTAYGHMEI